jgi:DNA-directed RNA polymerase I, II, and III subunit RPABC1
MLIAREVIDKSAMPKNVGDLLGSTDTFTLNVTPTAENDSKVYRIALFLDQKVSTFTKTSVVGEYVYKNKSNHLILVVDSLTSRARSTLSQTFPLVELFTINELMINIIDSVYVPQHILLSHANAMNLIKEYAIQKKDLPRILSSDPITRYYWASVGDIFQIIRPSETTGITHYYRIVVKEVKKLEYLSLIVRILGAIHIDINSCISNLNAYGITIFDIFVLF